MQWGYIDEHPFRGEVVFGEEKPRDRYVEDWEIVEALKLKSAYKWDKTLVIQEDGLHIKTSKTGKAIIYEWSDDLRKALLYAKQVFY